jgi:hypothetical protein
MIQGIVWIPTSQALSFAPDTVCSSLSGNILMEPDKTDLKTIFIEQLIKKGIEEHILPLFLKDLSNALSRPDSTDLEAVTNRLHLLGWIDFELDYHTFQLARAYFDQ